MGRMATILDVAKLAGVSDATAKRAFRAPHLLAPETLKRVKSAARELRYVPNQAAGGLRRGKNYSIGLVVGNIREPFFAELVSVISQEVREAGYGVLVLDSEYRGSLELKNLEHLYAHRVSGLIIRSAYGPSNLDYLLHMAQAGTYVCEIDYYYPDSPFSRVMLDNESCVREGVHWLHDLGHRRIAALGAYDRLINPDERSKVFPAALREVGLSLPDEYRRVISLTEDEAYQLTKYLLRLPNRPTALFALNGSGALGAFRAITESGLRIPDDVSLIGFDNYTWMQVVDPQIDVFEQPTPEMGRAAARIVVAAVEGAHDDVPVRQVFPGTLIRRGSTAPPPTSI